MSSSPKAEQQEGTSVHPVVPSCCPKQRRLLGLIETQNGLSWEGPLKVPLLAAYRDTHSSISAQSPIQPDLEWRIHHFSGQPVPVPCHPCRKKTFLLISSLNFPSFGWKPFRLVLSQHTQMVAALCYDLLSCAWEVSMKRSAGPVQNGAKNILKMKPFGQRALMLWNDSSTDTFYE